MEEIIKIKCPYCGAVLSVKNQAGIESKSVTCPICKQKSPFKDFKILVDKVNDESTQYPGDDEKTSYNTSSDSGTDIGTGLNFTLGKLKVIPNGPSFQLKPGKNVIGRQAKVSTADFQIPTEPGNNRLSREHLVVEVKKVQGKGFVHYASLYKQRVNKTYIGNVQLEYGDCIVLNHGDKIKLPDIVVKFEIPDDEGTDI
jgi:hypothetical protein